MSVPQGAGQTRAGWYADPGGSGQQRYWDGAQWTEHYSGGGGAPAAGGATDPTIDQIRFTSKLGGKYLAIFDGVVLEIFGAENAAATPASERFHRYLMTITIEEPDRKGTRKVEIYAGPSPSRAVPQRLLYLGDQDRYVIDFFERVRAALPAP